MGEAAAERPANLKCRSCGAAIFWGVSTSGAKVPLNAEPVTIADAGQYAVWWPDAGPGDPRALHRPAIHLTHFATCPNADAHRKPRGA